MQRTSTRSLLTRQQAAEMLAVSVDTVARLIDRGELRPVRIGRSVRVSQREVEALIERMLSGGAMSGRDDDRGNHGARPDGEES
jgi:excisionase family DNA binding protein